MKMSLLEYSQNILQLDEAGFYEQCYQQGLQEIKEILLIGALASKFNIQYSDNEYDTYCSSIEETTTSTDRTQKNLGVCFELLKNKVIKHLTY